MKSRFIARKRIPLMRRLMLSPAMLLSICIAGCSTATDGNILQEGWDRISMSGARIGYVHTITRELPKPQPEIITTVFTELRIRRFGFTLAIRTTVECGETSEGAMLYSNMSTSGGGSDFSSEGKVVGGNMELTTKTGGTVRTQSIPWDSEVIGPAAQSRKLRDSGLKPGSAVTFKMFIPDLQRVAASTITIEGREKVTVLGQERELYRANMVQDILPGVVTKVWVDDTGDTLKSETPLLGGLDTIRVSREEARESAAPADSSDLAAALMIRSNVAIENPPAVTEALYRIEGPIETLQIEDRRQKIESRQEGGILLRVKTFPAKSAHVEQPSAEYLAPSAYIQSDDPDIIECARKNATASSAEEKAKQLTAWVWRNMKKKDYSVGFASAKEALISREGDCTEHSVLLAALLRASGIPSRVAVGLIYWKGKFGYHMWTEAFLDDWTALDATLNETAVDATHIKLAGGPLDTVSAADPFLALVPAMGKIKINVEQLKRGSQSLN